MLEGNTNTPEIDTLSEALTLIFADLMNEETGTPVDPDVAVTIEKAVKSGIMDYVEELKLK